MPRSAREHSAPIAIATFLLIVIVLWVIPLTPVNGWFRGMPWLDIPHLLFIFIPLILMVALGRRREEYGLRPSRWHSELVTGALITFVIFFTPVVAERVFGQLQLRKTTLEFAVTQIISKLVFVGFGEELLFRGFLQGELNRAYPPRLCFGSVQFGWGVIITSMLFGVAHLLNPFNPLVGSYDLNFGDFALTAIIGLVLGLFREHFGSILAASLIHGAWDLVKVLMRVGTAGNLALGVALFGICLFCSIRVLVSKPGG